ncbi:MAG: hypothetical protein LBP85_00370 [Prevotellaceae bacterium]|jgi:hypothetical protein|nr:hypothetical protein [Prevotellaceae bacterium]
MIQIQHIENGESMATARNKVNSAIDAVNSPAGIAIPELILKPAPTVLIAQDTFDCELYICCKFPENAAFLQHNPKIYLYRKVVHSKYDRTALNKYPNAPLKMIRDREKLFSHPAHGYPNSKGVVIYSEFPFGNAAAIRFNDNYIFPLRIVPDGVNYTARFFASQFGEISDDSIILTRCSRRALSVTRNTYGSISVTAGFKLVTDAGESSMATCKVQLHRRIASL